MSLCRQFAATGRCDFGDRCRFVHRKPTASQSTGPKRSIYKPTPAAGPRAIAATTGMIDLVIDSTFPSSEAVAGRYSDGLLFPQLAQAYKQANSTVFYFTKTNTSIKDVAQAESLIQALAQSNTHNTGWTFEQRQQMLIDVGKVDGNAIVRLAEVLCFPRVQATANDKTLLSFSKSYMALIGYLTSETVLKTAALTRSNALFGVVQVNLDAILATLTRNIAHACKTTRSRTPPPRRYGEIKREIIKVVSGAQVFRPVATMLIELCQRYPDTPTAHPKLQEFLPFLVEQFKKWARAVEAGTFTDHVSKHAPATKKLVLAAIRDELGILEQVMASALPIQPQAIAASRPGPSVGLLAAINREYDGPGDLSVEGPRHSNDHMMIADITVPPTADEMIAVRDCYLPINIPGARHHHPDDSIEKILDIQFRLLRADSISGLQQGIKAVRTDMTSKDINTQLHDCIRSGGGWYIERAADRDSVRLPILTNLTFTSLTLEKQFGLVVQVQADAPPGPYRAPRHDQRKAAWEQSKRMPKGGLVAIITQRKRGVSEVAIGILTTLPKNFTHTDSNDGEGRARFNFGISFIDAQSGVKAAYIVQKGEERDFDQRILLESPVLYEAVRPFLQTLQTLDTVRFPLRKYLIHTDLERVEIDLPAYTRPDSFTWDLSALLREGPDVPEGCSFDPKNPLSIQNAREVMYDHGKLDLSQSDAVIDSLTREIALIQGPPGTGKTFTGVELLRVLFANKVGPILLLAFTNHALDHILRAVHDAKLTEGIVRLGTRSKDEVISGYNLDTISRVRGPTELNHVVNRAYYVVKTIESDMDRVISDLTTVRLNHERMQLYLMVHYPEIMAKIFQPPPHIQAWFELEEGGGWQRVTKDKKPLKNTLWHFWKDGVDIHRLQGLHKQGVTPEVETKKRLGRFDMAAVPVKKNKKQDEQADEERELLASIGFDFLVDMQNDIDNISDSEDSASQAGEGLDGPSEEPSDDTSSPQQPSPEILDDKEEFMAFFDFDALPPVPNMKRPTDAILDSGDVWNFSADERRRVVRLLEDEAKRHLDEDAMAHFEALADRHAQARKELNEASDNLRISLLDKIDLVGATTTGAAKLGGVMKGFSPKVLVIEEAGQVLEAHALSTLFPSIQHMIVIGDPLQLRPSVNTYEFSMDNRRGRDLFRFDMSMMERLASGGLPMSQLLVQRRMAPPISSLIRNTLYPNLIDHDLVKKYPDVVGMAKNLFFLDHSHRENGGGESGSSKSNAYEAAMACDLALYLLKQGCYNKEGDIVILCAYLGQMIEIRNRLKGKAMVVIDERDQTQLVKKIGEEDVPEVPETRTVAKEIQVGKQIFLRTVDNFQGEEADIIILSLVRNAGSDENLDNSLATTIGFLRSNNRTNVAISRAKHGLYILGNANQMAARSEMWSSVINELADLDAVGPGFPIACARHKEVIIVDQPGRLELVSPDGGCHLPCDGKLVKCGHRCKRKCHADDPNHEHGRCQEKCVRLHPCGHPCERLCADDCGVCLVVHEDVELPCGHRAAVHCHKLDKLGTVDCETLVSKPLPACEHSAMVKCHEEDMSDILCTEPCKSTMRCCSRVCTGRCSDCQRRTREKMTGKNARDAASTTKLVRTVHKEHPCGKPIPDCGHDCVRDCGTAHAHSTVTCLGDCLRTCSHGACEQPCNVACAPCPERCTWSCEHKKCELPCGMPCDRLPCDEPCRRRLLCGHLCSSICGEQCGDQVCTMCATPAQLNQVVDIILQATLRDTLVDYPDTRLITLECGHIFTVETLDGVLELHNYYEKNERDEWVGLKTVTDFQARKTCPTCRGPITSPRYNRSTKRALLDLQEKVAIRRYTAIIEAAVKQSNALDPAESNKQAQAAFKALLPGRTGKFNPKAMVEHLGQYNAKDTKCISPGYFTCKTNGFFGIAGAAGEAWRKVVVQHLGIYGRLVDIVNSHRMPHAVAFENAVSTIYWHEVEIARTSTVARVRDPKQAALLAAKRRIGAPPPAAQTRYTVEALEQTIDIRFKMVPIALTISDYLWDGSGLPKKKKKHGAQAKGADAKRLSRETAQRFKALATGLIMSCTRDAKLAVALATKSGLPRLILRAHFLTLKAAFENQKLKVQSGVPPVDLNDDNVTRAARSAREKELLAASAKAYDSAVNGWHTALNHVLRQNKDNTMLEDIAAPVRKAANALIAQWDKFNEGPSTWYDIVSLKEQEEIVRAVLAVEYGTAGRFYQCPNGHPYVIGDSGQAMVENFCECGALIGGGRHRIRDDNSRNVELEEIECRVGGQVNPFVGMFGN